MAKQQSLASSAGALAAPSTLPAVFSAPQDKLTSRILAPYVVFAHPKRADEWNKINGALGGVTEGEMYYIDQDGPRKLDKLKASLLAYKQFWVEKNPAGDLLRSSFAEKPWPWKEQIEAALLVYFDDKVVPALMTFKTTKCGGVRPLSDALEAAQKPDWADKSPAHKETLICAQAFMRFYGELQLGPTRTSKSSGLPYRPLNCVVKPTTPVEWRVLKELCEDPKGAEKLTSLGERFTGRIKEIEQKKVA